MSKTSPWLETVAGTDRCRLHATDGLVYAVYDVTYRSGKYRKFPLGSRPAESRIFRPAEGRFWRLYKFLPNESRAAEAVDLDRQLHSASYFTPNETIDTTARKPW